MNKTSTVLIGGIAVVALVVGFLAFTKPGQTIVNNPPLGSVTGPDSSFACESHNGVTRCFTQRPLTLATTTPCAIRAPSATSTLVGGALRVSVASSTATIWDVAKASTAFATTTALNGTKALASGVQGTLTATTTQVAPSDDIMIFAPNTWLVWGVRGVVPAGIFLNGSCNATFEVI